MEASLSEQFRRDGVVHVPGAFDAEILAEAQQCFDWSLANPSPAAQRYYEDTGTCFYQDLFNTLSWPIYTPLVSNPKLTGLVQSVLGCRNLWFFFEQVFLKKGGGDAPHAMASRHLLFPGRWRRSGGGVDEL